MNRQEWRQLLFTLCYLHSNIQERRKFGPIGRNVPYEFNQSDLSACTQFLQVPPPPNSAPALQRARDGMTATLPAPTGQRGPCCSWMTVSQAPVDAGCGAALPGH